MAEPPHRHEPDNLFGRLCRRGVLQTSVIYLAVAWGLAEALVAVGERFSLPPWFATLIVVLFVVGFPVAVLLSWAFDITRDGVRRAEVRSLRGAVTVMLGAAILLGGSAWLFMRLEPQALRSLAAGELAASGGHRPESTGPESRGAGLPE